MLSPSTEAFDRGEKFTRYQQLDSLLDYVLVSAKWMLVEQFTRQPDGHWLLTSHTQPEHRLILTSVDCELPLSEIYERVTLPSILK